MTGGLAVLLAGAAGAVWGGHGAPALRRLRSAAPTPPGPWPWSWPAPQMVARRAPVVGALMLAALVLAGLALPAVLLGTALALAVGPARRRSRREMRASARLAGELPGAMDLLATCLAAGLPPAVAVSEVAGASGGEVRDLLGPVGAALRMGVDPAVAWGAVAARGGAAGRLARAFVRASASGAPVAGTVAAVADDERERSRWAAEAAARRAGVRAVGPLAVCFLPAFVLVGVVPVVAAVAGEVLADLR